MDGTYYDHTGLPPSQSSSVIIDGRKCSLLSNAFLYPYYPQINAELNPTGSLSFSQPGPIQGVGESWMPCYEHHLPTSTLLGHEGVPHVWVGDSAYARAVEVDAIRNSGQHSLSTISLNQGHLYTHADTGRHQPIQSPETTKNCATESWSSGRPIGTREVQKQSYSCSICGEEYSQMQGVRRHIRTKHHPSSCLLCDFKWARPEHYRNHLTKRHDLELSDIDEIIGKPADSRRRTTIIGRDLTKNVSPAAIKHDRQAHAAHPNFSQTHPGRSIPSYALVEPSDGTYHHGHPA